MLPTEVKQPDYDSWLECSRCAEIIPIYQVEAEPTIQDSVSTIESPFVESKGEVLGHIEKVRERIERTQIWIGYMMRTSRES